MCSGVQPQYQRGIMAIRDILNKGFILFGGKGGVGKTTCAAATAFALLPWKTLVVSTDPAYSLGDCLGQQIGDEIIQIDRAANLYALEISAEKTLERFKIVMNIDRSVLNICSGSRWGYRRISLLFGRVLRGKE
jgi:cellulose biosynthesis protein BcsQ